MLYPPFIQVVDMHTGGEPVRIVTNGYPAVPGPNLLAKRRYVRENLDHLRRMIMYEPRGHYDMYGALLVEPTLPGADLGVLFMHNEGYSTMCGHAVIALGRYAVDRGLVAVQEPITEVVIECPCGLVKAYVDVQGGRSGRVRFDSVPAFVLAERLQVEVPDHGIVVTDLAYGGAFYAISETARFGLDVRTSPVRNLVDAARALTEAVTRSVAVTHPTEGDLAFLYGSILTDGREGPEEGPSANICVFADAEVDRSPTGSGVTARMAVRHQRGRVGAGQVCEIESITGARFTGEVLKRTTCGPHPAVVVQVGGRAHYMSEATFRLEEGDEIGKGFLLR